MGRVIIFLLRGFRRNFLNIARYLEIMDRRRVWCFLTNSYIISSLVISFRTFPISSRINCSRSSLVGRLKNSSIREFKVLNTSLVVGASDICSLGLFGGVSSCLSEGSVVELRIGSTW